MYVCMYRTDIHCIYHYMGYQVCMYVLEQSMHVNGVLPAGVNTSVVAAESR